MKRIIFLAIICLLGAVFFAETAYCLPWPPEADLVQISFNYDSGSHTYDALTIKKNGSTIVAPEYIESPKTNKKIAYIKSQSARKIKAKFWVDRTGYDTMRIYATKDEGDGIGNVNEKTVWFDGEQTSSETTMNCSNSVPSSVEKSYFTWRWYFTEIDDYFFPGGVFITESGPHFYYVVLAAPQAPMAQPWTEVLEYSCFWADGTTSSSVAADSVARHIYKDFGLTYDTIDGSPTYTDDGFTASFNLTTFLSDVPGSNLVVNCYDCGKAVKIFANALGCNASYKRSSPFGYLNCIKAIGGTWTNNPFYSSQSYPYNQPIVGEDDSGRTSFGNHAFGTLGSNIYDACLKVDTDANPDAAPHTESWAIGWSWSTYKDKVIDDNPAPPFGTGDPTAYSFSVY